MSTSYLTCYACPLRKVDGKRCEKLQTISNFIRGLGIKKIDFQCEARDSLFHPGQRVCYQFIANYGDGTKTVSGEAWVWKRIGNKIRVCRTDADSAGMSPIIKLFPNQLKVMDGGERRACLRCGKPEGVADVIRPRDGKPYDYVCTTTWNQLSDFYGESEPVDCVFRGPSGGETTYESECRKRREEYTEAVKP